MVDLIRKIIRWIIVFLIILLILHLIITLSNRSKTGNVNKSLSNNTGIKTIKRNKTEKIDETTTDNTNTSSENTNEVVETPDTGVNDYLGMIIGSMVLGSTTYYICRNKKVEE